VRGKVRKRGEREGKREREGKTYKSRGVPLTGTSWNSKDLFGVDV
jgi:hypothetical protein